MLAPPHLASVQWEQRSMPRPRTAPAVVPGRPALPPPHRDGPGAAPLPIAGPALDPRPCHWSLRPRQP